MKRVGKLEVCNDRYWGGVCGSYYETMIAEVVCKQLNYTAKGWQICANSIYYTSPFLCIQSPGRVFPQYAFTRQRPNAPTTAVLDNVRCVTGDETSLLKCFYNGGLHSCYYPLVVECEGMCLSNLKMVNSYKPF